MIEDVMLIKNCRILSSTGAVEGDILVEGERIKAIGRNLRPRGEDVIDAGGSPVMPGVVDTHVHVRDWKETHKEDYVSASRAALAGGVTTFLEMPNTSPAITSVEMLKKRVELGEKCSLVDFGVHLGFTPAHAWQDISGPSVKLYMDSLGERVEDALEEAYKLGRLLSIHCEDPRVIGENEKMLDDALPDDFLVHAKIRARKAETRAVELAASMAQSHGRAVHLCHLTLPSSISRLNRYTTCEVTPHHLLLSQEELKKKRGFAKTNPPLRPRADAQGLLKALQKCRIDCIASDHAPHTLEEKEQDVYSCPSGVPGLETMLRLMLDLVNRGVLGLPDLVRMMCENPAGIFKVKSKGFITPGGDADLLILDMKAETTIDSAEFHSKAKYSPFQGKKTRGNVKTVFLRGKPAFEDGELLVTPGCGRSLY